MRKLSITAVIILIVALVIAIGSQTFLGSCVHEDGSFGACHWAGRALLGEGLLLAAMAALALGMKDMRSGLFTASALTALLGMLTPGPLIALCRMDTMRCRMIMKPAMTILMALVLIASVAGLLLVRGRTKKG